jgi:hypothetical protein
VKKKKKCRGCGKVKKMDEFYAHPRMKDGHLNYCKTCKVSYQKNRPVDAVRKIEKKRSQKPKRKKFAYANLCRWRKENPDKVREQVQRYPEKRRARAIVARAIRDGKLKKGICACGSKMVHAHHEDYSKPLDVEWLCATCHAKKRY